MLGSWISRTTSPICQSISMDWSKCSRHPSTCSKRSRPSFHRAWRNSSSKTMNVKKYAPSHFSTNCILFCSINLSWLMCLQRVQCAFWSNYPESVVNCIARLRGYYWVKRSQLKRMAQYNNYLRDTLANPTNNCWWKPPHFTLCKLSSSMWNNFTVFASKSKKRWHKKCNRKATKNKFMTRVSIFGWPSKISNRRMYLYK